MGKAHPEVLGRVCRLLGSPLRDCSDGQLLSRFVSCGDEKAFSVLMERHGGMVLRVCRRVLRNEQDAEDAFQATFLLLARKASSIRSTEAVASWLHAVAYRLALRSRARNANRQAREQEVAETEQGGPLETTWLELQAILDEELHRLPQKYQAPLLLCYLDGKTHEEAARELGCPVGTIHARVSRGRNLLRERLARRGLPLTAIGFAALLASNTPAAVAAPLFTHTLKATLATAAGGQCAPGLVSAEALALADGGITMLASSKLKFVLAILLTLGAVGLGALGISSASAIPEQPGKSKPEAVDSSVSDTARPAPLPAGAIARLGDARFFSGGMNPSGLYMALSPDGKRLALPDLEHVVRVWDLVSGEEIALLGASSAEHPRCITFLEFSRDGKLLASVENTDSVQLWDVETGKSLHRLGGAMQGTLFCCTVSPDGKQVAAPAEGGAVLRWDVASGKLLPGTVGHDEATYAVAYSPDGSLLATAGEDQEVRLWEAGPGKAVRTLQGHREKVVGLAFSPDGKQLASRGMDQTVRFWDVKSGEAIRKWATSPSIWTGQGHGNAHAIGFSSDGKKVLLGGNVGLSVRDAASGRELKQHRGIGATGSAVVLSRDGKTLAGLAMFGQRVHLWDAESGKELHPAKGHVGGVLSVAYAPDGKTIATGGRDKTVRVWDLDGKELHTLNGHTGAVGFLVYSADGKQLVSASRDSSDRTVSLWEVGTGKEVRQFRGLTQSPVTLGLAGDGKHVLALDRSGKMMVWETATGKKVHEGKPNRVVAAAIAPDGKTIITIGWREAATTEITIHKVGSDDKPRTFDAAEGGVSRVTYAPDGRTFLVASYTGGLQLWDVEAGSPLRWVRKSADKAPPTHLYSLAAGPVFSPDGKTLAVPGLAGKVHLIELASGKERLVLQGGPGPVSCLTFSPDGTKLVSAGEDGSALVWEIKTIKTAQGIKEADLDKLWADLAGADAVKAHQAIRALASTPKLAVPFLRKSLPPATETEQKQVDQLVADLGSKEFNVRKKAEEELSKLGLRARPALRLALDKKPSLDLSQRLETLLRALEDRNLNPDEARVIRAVEAVEAMDTAEARKLLEEWAGGAPASLLTEEAKSSLKRLTTRR